MLVIETQHLVQIYRVDGPTEYLSYILAAIRFRFDFFATRSGVGSKNKEGKMHRFVSLYGWLSCHQSDVEDRKRCIRKLHVITSSHSVKYAGFVGGGFGGVT